jgi:hypothetical protein
MRRFGDRSGEFNGFMPEMISDVIGGPAKDNAKTIELSVDLRARFAILTPLLIRI